MSNDAAQIAARMRVAGYVLPMILASGALVRMVAFWRGVARARAFAAAGERFERRSPSSAGVILVLGDSTGVGVGAHRPEESVAGRLAVDFPDADIVNVSRSGARVGDALEQARQCLSLSLRFDLAVLHVGANDVVRATPAAKLAADCEALLGEMKGLAGHTVWLGPPNVGLAPLFPRPYAWLLGARSRAAALVFAAAAARHGAVFIDFCAPEHASLLSQSRRCPFAADGFHPNSTTYGHGYSALRAALAAVTFAATVQAGEAAPVPAPPSPSPSGSALADDDPPGPLAPEGL